MFVNWKLIIENFSIDNKDCFGFQKACKICQNANSKLYNDNNKEYFKQKGKEKYKKEDNSKRYQKYKESYLKRSADFSKTIRGKLDNLLQDSSKYGLYEFLKNKSRQTEIV